MHIYLAILFLNGNKLQNKELKFLVLIFDINVLENLRFGKFFQAYMFTSFVFPNKCLSILLKDLNFIPFLSFKPPKRIQEHENLSPSMHDCQYSYGVCVCHFSADFSLTFVFSSARNKQNTKYKDQTLNVSL